MKTISLLLGFLLATPGLLPAQTSGTVQSVAFSNNSATVVFSASPSFIYYAERSTNLSDWTLLTSTNVPASGIFQIIDVFPDLGNVPPDAAFYRLATPGPTSSLTVSGFPTPHGANTFGNLTVTAKDTLNNVVTTYSGTIHFTSSDNNSTLPQDYTFTPTDAGTHNFIATLNTATNAASITATDTGNPAVTGTQSPIVITATIANALAVSGFPGTNISGVASNFTVTAKDPFGNVAPSYRGTVHFTSVDPAAVLPVDYTFTAGDAGKHTFSATLNTGGTGRTIIATDTGNPTISGTQSAITVTASTLILTNFPSPQVAGLASNFTVTAKDSVGNTVTIYRGVVHFTTSDPLGIVPANYTFVAADAGIHTFSATLKTAGTNQSITATDTVNPFLTATQSNIIITATNTTKLSVTNFPSPQTAGVAGTFTVTAKDPYGNTATNYLGTVHFTSNDTAAVLPANYVFTTNDFGIHTFSATLNTVGTGKTITAIDTVTATITGAQSAIQVTP